MEIEHGRKGTPSRVGEASTFSGRAMLYPLLEDADGAVRINSVLFSPGGRTFWHSHAGGQTNFGLANGLPSGGPSYYATGNGPYFYNDKGWVSLTFSSSF